MPEEDLVIFIKNEREEVLKIIPRYKL